jgi:hypothetical protein
MSVSEYDLTSHIEDVMDGEIEVNKGGVESLYKVRRDDIQANNWIEDVSFECSSVWEKKDGTLNETDEEFPDIKIGNVEDFEENTYLLFPRNPSGVDLKPSGIHMVMICDDENERGFNSSDHAEFKNHRYYVMDAITFDPTEGFMKNRKIFPVDWKSSKDHMLTHIQRREYRKNVLLYVR